jgi:CBS domain-containing protein
MTLAQQMLETLGLDTGTPHQTLMRAQRSMRRATSRVGSDVPRTYAWVGAAFVAGATLLALRATSGRRHGRRIKDVMVGDMVTVPPSATILEAAQKMREGNVGILPVVENGVLRGVLTDRDIVVRGVARGADATTTRVSDCATRELACAQPDWDIEDAMRVMAECQIGRLPVTDGQSRLIGIVTLSSLALRSRKRDGALNTARAVSRRSSRAA